MRFSLVSSRDAPLALACALGLGLLGTTASAQARAAVAVNAIVAPLPPPPLRAEVVAVSNESQPGIATLPPAATVSETAAKRPSSTFETAAWLWPVSAAILATSSVLFSDIVFVFLSGARNAHALACCTPGGGEIG